MKAFVHKQVDGIDRLGTGVNAGLVTPKYSTLTSMKRCFLDKLPPGTYHVEGFYNWDNRYGKPDVDFVYEVRGECHMKIAVVTTKFWEGEIGIRNPYNDYNGFHAVVVHGIELLLKADEFYEV
jgi:hypothetical protein